MNNYTLTTEYVNALRKFLGTKPYDQVFQLLNMLKTEMSEQELNNILSYVGHYPWDEVHELFDAANVHIKLKKDDSKEVVNEPNGVTTIEDNEIAVPADER